MSRLPTQKGHIINATDVPDHRGPARPVNCVRYNADGCYLLSGGHDRRLHLWNGATGAHVQSYDAHGYEVADVAVNRENTRLASVGGDKLVFFWDVVKAVTLRRFAGHFQRCNCVAFGQDTVVSGSLDATVRVWDTRSNATTPIQTLDHAKDAVTALVVEEEQIITGAADGRIRTYDLRQGRLTTDVVGSPISSIELSRDGQTLLAASLDARVRAIDRRSGGVLGTFEGHRHESSRLHAAFLHDEAHVACGSEDGHIYLWNADSGELRAQLTAHDAGVVSGLDCHPTLPRMASGGSDGTIVLWT